MDYLREHAKNRRQGINFFQHKTNSSSVSLTTSKKEPFRLAAEQEKQNLTSLSPFSHQVTSIQTVANPTKDIPVVDGTQAALSLPPANEKAVKTSSNERKELTAAEIKAKENEEDLVVCSQCGERVSPFELPEHLDFHFAQQLQEESGSRGTLHATAVRTPSTAAVAAAGKRKRDVGAAKESAKKSKNGVDISRFFTKKL